MAYKIYSDGEIWKDGKKYAAVYADGEIWRDGQLYAKVYGDGEIWKDGRKIGKVYDDGEVWIDNAKWGKIYSSGVGTPAPVQKDDPKTDNSAYSAPGVPESGGGIELPGFGIFAFGFIILFLCCSVAAVFFTGINMWKEFTVGRIAEFGPSGAIAAGILIAGVIFGFVTQYSKFNGGFIAGLIMQSVIIFVASMLGAVVVAGGESITMEGMDLVAFFGMFIYMALFPALLCKLVALLANKFGWKSNNCKEVKIEKIKNRQEKAAVAHKPQTTGTARTTTQKTNTQKTKHTRKKSNAEQVFEELFDYLEDKPLIVKVLVYGILLLACVWVFSTLFTEYLHFG